MDQYLYNQSLHQDFHIGFNDIIIYLRDRYGEEALRKIMTASAKKVYKPLIEEIKDQGIKALRAHFTQIMELEDGGVGFKGPGNPNGLGAPGGSADELTINVMKDPVIAYLIKKGVSPDGDFLTITAEVMQDAIAEEAGYTHRVEYNQQFLDFLKDFGPGAAGTLPEFPVMYSHHWQKKEAKQ